MKRDCNKARLLYVGFLVGVLITSFIFLSSEWITQLPYSVQFMVHGYTKENALAICSGKSLEKTSLCVNSFVKKIYKFNPTDDKKVLSLEELKTLGGDCKNFSELYTELLNKLGFKVKKIGIDVSKEDNVQYKHMWVVAYDETGYTLLDQNRIFMFKYKE